MSPSVLAAPLSATVVVERAADAVACPSAQVLTARLETTVGRSLDSRGERVIVHVAFSRSAAGYQASLSLSGAREGERQLRDTGTTCEALTDAVVVAIALLFDQPAEPAVVHPTVATEREQTLGLWLAVRFGGGLGLVGEPTWIASGAFAASLSRVTWLELAAGTTGATQRAFGSGAIRVQLRYAELGAFHSFTGERLLLGPSVALLAGATTGKGRGYPTSTRATLPWFAVGAGVGAGMRFGRIVISLRALLVVPSQRQAFSVGYAGVGYESSVVSALADGGVALRFW